MPQSYTPYLDFLRFSLNEEAQVPESVKLIDWDQLLQFAKDQCVPGIYWMGVRRLGNLKENKPTDDHVMRWMAACGKLGKRNCTVTERSAWVAKNFEKEGFRACLLKGQGLALCYPDPSLRYPGDIDIWVRPDRQSRSSNATASRSNGSFSTKAAKPSASAASQRLSNLEVYPVGELLKEVWWGLSPSLRGRAGVGFQSLPYRERFRGGSLSPSEYSRGTAGCR